MRATLLSEVRYWVIDSTVIKPVKHSERLARKHLERSHSLHPKDNIKATKQQVIRSRTEVLYQYLQKGSTYCVWR